MSNAMQLVPFGESNLTALAQAFAAIAADEFTTGMKPSFAVLRHKIGRSWQITEGKDNKIVILDAEGQPARTVDVIIVRATPGLSNTWYSGPFDSDNPAPPDCYSNLGDVPAPDSKMPQAKSCAACPHAVWGPQPTDKPGVFRHGRACRQSKRLAVVNPNALDKPMLWTAPPDSFKGYEALVKWLAERGLTLPAIVVRLGFDPTLDTLRITFKPTGGVPTEFVPAILAVRESDTALAICGAVRAPDELHQPMGDVAPTAPVEPVVPVVDPAAQQAADTAKAVAAATAALAAAQAAQAAQAATAPAAAAEPPKDQILTDMDNLDLDAELAGLDFGTPA